MNTESLLKVAEVSLVYKTKVKASERPRIKCSKDVYRLMKQVIGEDIINHHEEVWVMLLNLSNRVIGVSRISSGGINSAIVDVRLILQVCIKANASNFVLVHNHPGGGNKPSPQDDAITEKVFIAAKYVDIKLYDHIIVTDEEFYSYADKGRSGNYEDK